MAWMCETHSGRRPVFGFRTTTLQTNATRDAGSTPWPARGDAVAAPPRRGGRGHVVAAPSGTGRGDAATCRADIPRPTPRIVRGPRPDDSMPTRARRRARRFGRGSDTCNVRFEKTRTSPGVIFRYLFEKKWRLRLRRMNEDDTRSPTPAVRRRTNQPKRASSFAEMKTSARPRIREAEPRLVERRKLPNGHRVDRAVVERLRRAAVRKYFPARRRVARRQLRRLAQEHVPHAPSYLRGHRPWGRGPPRGYSEESTPSSWSPATRSRSRRTGGFDRPPPGRAAAPPRRQTQIRPSAGVTGPSPTTTTRHPRRRRDTRLRGIFTWHPRRRRETPPRKSGGYGVVRESGGWTTPWSIRPRG